TVNNWATLISAGPANESGQTVSFNVSNDNNSLFTVQPSISATGTLTYTIANSVTGSATVTVSISDDGGTANGGVDISGTQTFTINVSSTPVAPVANADSPTGTEDTSLTYDVLANDTDGTSAIDPATVDLDPATPGIQSTVTTDEGTWLVVNGEITFAPASNFNGTAIISYTVSDTNGLTSNAVTISAVIDAVNDPPVIADKTITTTINTIYSGSVLTSDDIDPDGSPLVVSTTPVSGPSNGSIIINADGTFTYTPNPGFTGTDVITIEICDTGLPLPATCVTRTITINVVDESNGPPVVENQNVDLNENSPNGTEVLTVSASDADNDALAFAITDGDDNGFFEIDPNTGVITILNNEGIDFETNTSFVLTISVTDEYGNVTTAAITITIINSDAEDTDDDGISDTIEKGSDPGNPVDTDEDGVPDFKDKDSDNDGLPDSDETTTDSDGDGISDFRDTDSDNDGVADAVESGGNEPTGNDADHDGIDDAFDADQGNQPTSEPIDTDDDDIPDHLDTDDDNDGVSTTEELSHGDNVTDHDDDQIADYLDSDDDNDGIPTNEEDRNEDGNFFNDDCDGDTVPDFIDADQCKVKPGKGFSPNGDGQNDTWIIDNIEEYPNNSVKVFNRWGNIIYEVRSYNNDDRAWGGESDGKWTLSESVKVPDGTYFYAIDLGDGSKTIGGFIVLKR
ncbi:MAG TPA: Ig-like domain-containing protein, partial [Chryseosolibacter sp.]|nr:Ig-like domain-containing protein [Chryseosolibacter sp.]